MSTLRFEALKVSSARKPVKFEELDKKSAIFGSNVFNDKSMRQYLTSDAYQGVKDAVQHGKKIDRKLADYIALGMKEWALSKGVTHYTHHQISLPDQIRHRTFQRKHHAFRL